MRASRRCARIEIRAPPTVKELLRLTNYILAGTTAIFALAWSLVSSYA
jgi:hypothetical protein